MEICNINKFYLCRYFEGKENDVRSKNYKPGKISEELRVYLKYD